MQITLTAITMALWKTSSKRFGQSLRARAMELSQLIVSDYVEKVFGFDPFNFKS